MGTVLVLGASATLEALTGGEATRRRWGMRWPAWHPACSAGPARC
jgi:hypothetical protein